jgi:hypothetical protein
LAGSKVEMAEKTAASMDGCSVVQKGVQMDEKTVEPTGP